MRQCSFFHSSAYDDDGGGGDELFAELNEGLGYYEQTGSSIRSMMMMMIRTGIQEDIEDLL
ncbi:hypothetical protein BLA29_010798 [Euroglyphus maynei]|uniref:Uncharacterized protein n=1 Tax=Euroglyphus maynei TaxID=6958 RepID=A0A1Y3BHE2_EURMA|nr:hypothetical protein BLA29_010798 [Euroglyphus maynei]